MESFFSYALVFVIGSVVGSFLNVVIYRLPSISIANIRPNASQGLSYLAIPLSFCPHCTQQIKPWHNIPIISYLVLIGKSPCCNREISPRYLFVEVIGALIPVLCLARFGWSYEFLFACLFSWTLIVICWVDYQTYILPDILVQPLLWLGLIFNLNFYFVSINEAILGVILGYFILFVISEGSVLLLRKKMLGSGDAKLLAAIGAWLGWKLVIGVLIVAALSATLVGVITSLRNKQSIAKKLLAFGPYLGFGGFVMLIYGYYFSSYYLN